MKADRDIRILLNVDSENDALLFLNKIKSKGYNPKYKIVKTCKDVSDAISKDEWDVMLADYKLLSDFNLLDVLRMLKESDLAIYLNVLSDPGGLPICPGISMSSSIAFSNFINIALLSISIFAAGCIFGLPKRSR